MIFLGKPERLREGDAPDFWQNSAPAINVEFGVRNIATATAAPLLLKHGRMAGVCAFGALKQQSRALAEFANGCEFAAR